MLFKRFKPLYFILSIVFVWILISSFLFFSSLAGANKLREEEVVKIIEKPTISEGTIIQKESRYLCGDRILSSISTTEDLIGLDYEGLLEYFPPEEGWEIDDTVPNYLTLSRGVSELCSEHQNYYHIGSYENKLAIYKGPLGYDKLIVGVKEIPVDILPKELRENLALVKDFEKQNLALKNKLRSHLEFASEEALNSKLVELLEEFDEILKY